MSKFSDFAKQFTVDTTAVLKKYVYYNHETGKIAKITNKNNPSENLEVLEVNFSQVEALLLGKRQFHEFYVAYNTALKRMSLKEVVNKNSSSDIGQRLYLIPETSDAADITFIKDEVNNTLRVVASETLRADPVIYQQSAKIGLNFSVTAKADPNILYENVTVNLQDLLENEFLEVDGLFKYSTKLKNTSIYTTKFFETYSVKVS